MQRGGRLPRFAVAALAVMAVTACADPQVRGGVSDAAPPASTAAAAPTTPPCPAAGGVVSAGPVDGATGARAVTLFLANCGSAPYTVEGYPGIGLLDDERQRIAVEVLEAPDPIGSGTPGPVPLTLAPGGQARAVLLWRNTVELGLENTPGSFVVVTPAPGQEEQVVPLDVDLGTTGRLTVGPWTPAG